MSPVKCTSQSRAIKKIINMHFKWNVQHFKKDLIKRKKNRKINKWACLCVRWQDYIKWTHVHEEILQSAFAFNKLRLAKKTKKQLLRVYDTSHMHNIMENVVDPPCSNLLYLQGTMYNHQMQDVVTVLRYFVCMTRCWIFKWRKL